MSLEFCRRGELSSNQIATLEKALEDFYQHPPPSYYQIANQAAQHYNPEEMPFHCDLLSRVFPGASVLEMGCGTAHLCAEVEARGGIYTGLDYSERLLAENRRQHSRARFFPIGTPLPDAFDIVASLYTIEHIVDPPAYLESLWAACRPGGLVAVICPEFVECSSLPPSLFYGRTSRRLSEKIRALDFGDAIQHVLDWKVRGPQWKRLAQTCPPGAFWLNLRPRVLHGADYTIDADAVHLVQLRDLVYFFENKGATILQTSRKMSGISAEVRRYNCYVLAQKPVNKSDSGQ